MPLEAKLHDLLKKYWGYNSFRAQQKEIITSVLAGNDTLALLPTGGGKSLCYQLPALYSQGLCLVISPLIALMQDQVTQLREKGIPAETIHAGMSAPHIERILNQCVYGGVKLLYVSPERLKTSVFLGHLPNMPINLIAVDEAHCISQWGHDFRLDYRTIANLRPHLPGVPVLALTATATTKVADDIQDNLQFHKKNVFQTSFSRPNLSYMVFEECNKDERLLRILRTVPGSAIIYARTRERVEQTSRMLLNEGMNADFYHAGISTEERTQKQTQWTQGKTRIMVATNAFGMGINKENVRMVVHLEPPSSIEAYFQEAGRAGRDGKQAYAVLLYTPKDIKNIKKDCSKTFPDKDFIKIVYQAVFNHVGIAVGDGAEYHTPFDMNTLCKKHHWTDVSSVQHALKLIQRSGIWHLSETPHKTSRLRILVSREQFYKFDTQHPFTEGLADTVLRNYEGILHHLTDIQEEFLARKINRTPGEIAKIFSLMAMANIVTYEPKSPFQEITFLVPRQPISYFHLPKEVYDNAKQLAEEKLNHIIAYMKQNECRVQYMLHYFGEKTEPCETCDICIVKRKAQAKVDSKKLEKSILNLIGNRDYTLAEIEEIFFETDTETVIEMLRQLCDREKLFFKDNSIISSRP